jgi:hypothetical protein
LSGAGTFGRPNTPIKTVPLSSITACRNAPKVNLIELCYFILIAFEFILLFIFYFILLIFSFCVIILCYFILPWIHLGVQINSIALFSLIGEIMYFRFYYLVFYFICFIFCYHEIRLMNPKQFPLLSVYHRHSFSFRAEFRANLQT